MATADNEHTGRPVKQPGENRPAVGSLEEKVMFKRLRQWFRTVKCNHSHIFRWNLPPDTPWYSHGVRKGAHPGGLQIVGCYICGKVWCRDYRA